VPARAASVPVVRRRTSWTEEREHDPGVTLLELLAYAAELLTAYQEQIAEEARLRRRRRYALALAAAVVVCVWRRRGDPSEQASRARP
jgi:hypothetical protein